MMKCLGHGIHISAPITCTLLDQWGITFVGDANLFVYDTKDTDERNISQEGQLAFDMWGYILVEKRGILNLPKYHYSM